MSGKKKLPCRQVLTIAGSDPSGGAGIQGDIKSIQANGAYAMSVITAVTAQNTLKMDAAKEMPLWIIEAQMKAIFEDFEVSAIKTGMLSSKSIVKRVADLLKRVSIKHLVVDPVMISKSGYPLLKPDAISVLVSNLIPLATLLTPNIEEANQLAGTRIRTIGEAEAAAQKIAELGCLSVLIKGGHLEEKPGCDILFHQGKITLLKGRYLDTPHTHGTGCTYSAAIATHLAFGLSLVSAVKKAKHYITEAIHHPLEIGHGHGPTNHFYFLTSPEVP